MRERTEFSKALHPQSQHGASWNRIQGWRCRLPSKPEVLLSETKDLRLEVERELLPFRDGVDGAYVAQLSRR
jgi:hypothetical protein